ncbi:MAG: hypothetical protein ORN54_08100 [Cyclobacteriaceae bacterium]|nr:hypothetical protein [Cyclobacteriaceae bacterium]
MRRAINRHISGKKIFWMLIVTNLIYVIMVTITIPRVMSFAGGMKILDMMLTGYTPDYVNSLLTKLGTEGRYAYLYNQLPLDAIYPFMYGTSYCLLLAYLLKKLNKLNGNFFYLCLIPLFLGFFDYCENIGIVAILTTYPNNPVELSKITSAFSVLKSTLILSHFTILIICLAVLGRNKIFERKVAT